MEKKKTLKWMVMMMAFFLLMPFNGCKDDDDDDDGTLDYVGTWQMTDNEGGMEMKQTIVLTANAFTVTMQVKIGDVWVTVNTMEGTFTVDGSMLNITITKVGMLDDESNQMVYYTKASPEWATILAEDIEMPETFEAKYIVAGNTLTMIIDDNDDGVYDPVEEGEVYTKG